MKTTRIFLLFLTVFLLSCIAIAFGFFNATFAEYIERTVTGGLRERTLPNAISFKTQMQQHEKLLNTVTDFIAIGDDLWSKENLALIDSMVKNNGLLRCAISLPNGDSISHDGIMQNVADSDFFIRAMNGEFNVTDPRLAVVDETKSVIIVTGPIVKDGKIIGALSYAYLNVTTDSVFKLEYFDANARVFVVKQNGEIIMGDTLTFDGETNIVEYLHRDGADDHDGISGVEDSHLHYTDGGKEKLYVNYYYLDINDWYLFSIVPGEAVSEPLMNVSNAQQGLAFVVAACIIVYALALAFLWAAQRTNIDKLTGAPTFEKFKHQATAFIKKNPQQRYFMSKFDVKDFKLINRLYSFNEGDRFIKNIAIALKETLPANAMYARLNNDTFVLLYPSMAEIAVSKVRMAFILKFKKLMGDNFKTIVEFPTGQCLTTEGDAIKLDITELFEKVNFAHQHAKKLGGGVVVDYDEVLEKEAIFQKTIEDKMEAALKQNEFTIFLQPKYRVSDEAICGAEALVRWQVDNKIVFNPGDFVPVFEKNGFIVKIDMFMYEIAVKKIKVMLDEGLVPCIISINFSRFHLNNKNFVADLCRIADSYGVPHKYFEVELTESVVFDNTDLIIQLLADLHKNDFTLAMDDFGSGYSSLGLLKNLKIDVMKIDQTFFQNNRDEERANVVIKNIMNLARDLGIKTVAEGVETKEQVQMLRAFDCDMIQGYYYAKPMPADDFINLCIEGKISLVAN